MRRYLVLLALITAGLWSTAPAPSIAAPPPNEAFTPILPPAPAPDVAYVTANGETALLTNLKGKVLVVNFWATWCAPCVKELPSLDRLAGQLDPDRFHVLVLSNDRGGETKAKPFLDDLGIMNLAADLDPKSKLARALGLRGLPTTFVFDANGRAIAKLEGLAEWDAPEVVDWLEAVAAE